MKLKVTLAFSLALCLFAISLSAAHAGGGNWKMGRIYYRMVCTDCHKAQTGNPISPSTMTKDEWAAYIKADAHAKGTDSLKHYVSQDYRNSIKETNKAAKKLAKKSNDAMLADVHAFVIHGAKDSDTPARCQ